jgi:hypothetical protein
MRSLTVILLLIFIAACEKPTGNDKLIRDLGRQYQEIAIEKFTRAQATYNWGHEIRLKDVYQHPGTENENLRAMTNRLDRMFAVVRTFSAFADSMQVKYTGERNYPLDVLIARYGSAIDSLNAYHRINESRLNVTDFRKSAFVDSPEITIARMKADVAENGHEAMYAYIDVTAPHVIFDDFGTPTIKQVFKGKTAYGFSIHYRAGQEYPNLHVAIDTVMLNGKIIKPNALMHHDDILWVVNFNKLEKGKYEVHGRVRAISNKLDIRPFVHRFQIL